jgi:hypothetical protein
MPITYRIDLQKRRLHSVGTGPFSYDEIKLHREQLRNDPDFDPTFTQLADFSDYDSSNVSPDEVIELAKTSSSAIQARRAIVASKPLTFGMARVFAAHRISQGETGIRVFHTVREAEAWLDDVPEEEPTHHPIQRRTRA